MKAVRFHEHGSAAHLVVDDISKPEPAAGEALVEIKAAALNGFDPMILNRTTTLKNPLPMIPCGDAAGVIVALGEDAAGDFHAGDRVSVLPYGDHGMYGETALGMAREYACIPLANLVPVPDEVSFVDAAALPVAYGTAYRLMHTRGQITAADTVLILGAAGGVGTGCVQFAKAAGATVIACASGTRKLDKLKEIGSDHVIDTRGGDLIADTLALVGKPRYGGEGGISMVVNYIAGDTWAQSLKILAHGGRMLTCGASAGYDPATDVRYIWSRELSIIGSDGWTRDDHAKILEMTASGALTPHIHAVRPFSAAAEAMQEMLDRQVFGKSILVPDEQGSDG